ncbi:AraC family transcriptional regulator [uncultured Corynebacterium sp.]|uniref:helix-turn-helix domain-containing protein n=1 Tax=uncultured Corynebacterium sp. TaxID=159447 RepID=UPI0025F9F4D7|nr:AraC family transcriptional regulator [uncultured Corynebacterium sp.]
MHSEHHVFWVVCGSATAMVDGEVFQLEALDALWLPGGIAVDQISTEAGTVAFTVLLPTDTFPETGNGVVHRKISPELCTLLIHLFGRWKMPAWDGEKLTGGMATALRESFFGGRTGAVERPRMPVSAAAVAVAQQLLADPGDPRSREQWATGVGLSERQLTRAFRVETGLSLSSWRVALKVAVAAEQVALGTPIGRIAHDLGYSGTAALSHAFRRQTRTTLSEVCSAGEGTCVPQNQPSSPDLDLLIPADRMRPNINEFHVCIGVLRGFCRVVLQGQQINLPARNLLWLPAGVWHQLETVPGTVVVPVGTLSVSVPLHRRHMVSIPVTEADHSSVLYRACVSFTRLKPYPMIAGVMDDLVPTVVQLRAAHQRKRQNPVVEIITGDLSVQRTLHDWAERFGMRTEILSRRFEEVTGQPYRDWIVDRRMTVARRLLTNPDRRVIEVASAVGYGSSAAFVRVFKDRVGMTPGRYQRQYRKREIFEVVE